MLLTNEIDHLYSQERIAGISPLTTYILLQQVNLDRFISLRAFHRYISSQVGVGEFTQSMKFLHTDAKWKLGTGTTKTKVKSTSTCIRSSGISCSRWKQKPTKPGKSQAPTNLFNPVILNLPSSLWPPSRNSQQQWHSCSAMNSLSVFHS